MSNNTINNTIIRPTEGGVFPWLRDGIYTVALGNGAQYEVVLMRHASDRIVLGVIGHGVYSFYESPHPSCVAEKLGVDWGDAANLCDFLRDQFGLTMTTDPQGEYLKSLCSLVRAVQ